MCIYTGSQNRHFDSDPLADYKNLVACKLSPKHLLIAFLSDQPVGVLVIQVFDDLPSEGTIYNFGLFPELRGKGLGKVLHAKGLAELSSAGVSRMWVQPTNSTPP